MGAGSGQNLYGTARSRRILDPDVECQKGHLESLGQSDVRPESPAPVEQRPVWHSVEAESQEITHGEPRSSVVEFTPRYEPAPCRDHLDVDQMGRNQVFAFQPHSGPVAVWTIVCEGGDDHAG